MNLHGIVAPYIAVVNPPVLAGFFRSTGPVTQSNGVRLPSFAAPVQVSAQVQQLSSRDLRQVEGLNLQGYNVAIYLYGSADGVVRVTNKGGDIIGIPGGANAGIYLVTMVLERWADWTKVVATLQNQQPTGSLDFSDPNNSQYFPAL